MKIINTISEVRQLSDELFIHYTGSMLGMSCKATNEVCINRIKRIKARSDSKSMILLFDSLYSIINELELDISKKNVYRFLKNIWPSNTTIILPNNNAKYDHLAIEGKLAVRVPTDKFLRHFLEFHGPIVSTSVNTANNEPLDTIQAIENEFSGLFDYAILPINFQRASNAQSTIIDISQNNLKIVRPGSVSQSIIESVWDEVKICFACVANVCRSPVAEYYARHSVNIPNRNLVFSSCGYLKEGKPVSKNSAIALLAWGIDASDHLSRQLTKEILQENDYIFALTKEIKEVLLKLFPTAQDKIFFLGEITGTNKNIEDPFSMDLMHYYDMARVVKHEVDILAVLIENREI
ncbi:MAG TPA: Sua5/YciO/YrdC/YwlC family protein [Candidatus Cloacimonadota bacterium]|jgi:protein-tyrosine phosphatase|nr:Sua5/YciO/YrdC/YwlC family protein [Candidatus Cloacimonadales bacterium]HPY96429.1 Sua5/YciO/YrdC/YwlC family protein [Candidatus Cloacimonadota bacterium]HQB41425.1 Sua5/YciO/YrdC/YwlC family protein [Candidatus Cloacimonadota bacterium]